MDSRFSFPANVVGSERSALLTVEINRDSLARYGLQIGTVQDAIVIATGGKKGGELFEGDKRFDLVV